MQRKQQKNSGVLPFSAEILLDGSAQTLGLREGILYHSGLSGRRSHRQRSKTDPFDNGFLFTVFTSDGCSPDSCRCAIEAQRTAEEWKFVSPPDYFRYCESVVQRYFAIVAEKTGVALREHVADIRIITPLNAPAETIADEKLRQNAERLFPSRQRMRVIGNEIKAGVLFFALQKSDVFAAAPFRAGQYVSIVDTGSGEAVPFLFCSSPSSARVGRYTVCFTQNVHSSETFFRKMQQAEVEVEVSAPKGCFYFQPLRDRKTVIGMTDAEGVGAFLAMAAAIRDDLERFKLTVLYFQKKPDEISLTDEFDRISERCGKLRLICVSSDPANPFTADQLRPYLPHEAFSVFICGSPALCGKAKEITKSLRLPWKSVHVQQSGTVTDGCGAASY